MINTKHVYEVRARKDKRGFDLVSDVLPFGRQRNVETSSALHGKNSTGTVPIRPPVYL